MNTSNKSDGSVARKLLFSPFFFFVLSSNDSFERPFNRRSFKKKCSSFIAYVPKPLNDSSRWVGLCQKIRSSTTRIVFFSYRLAADSSVKLTTTQFKRHLTNGVNSWHRSSHCLLLIIIIIMAMSPLQLLTLASIMSRTFSSKSVETLDCFSFRYCCCSCSFRHFCSFHLVYIYFFCFLSHSFCCSRRNSSLPSFKSNQKGCFLLHFSFFHFFDEMKWEENQKTEAVN